MKKGDSIKDNIFNTFYLVKNYIFKNILKQKGKFKIPSNYNLVLEDNFSELDNSTWMTTQYFGAINSVYHWQYCAGEAVEFTNSGLKLNQYYNPRTVDYWDEKTYNTLFDVGCVTSKIPFTYGIFEFKVILPEGAGLWPAVWFTGYDTYPPEFDLIEAYSDYDGNYNSALNTNAHYGLNDVRTELRARKSLFFKESELKKELDFKLVWDENKLEYYVNNFKVRTLTRKKVFKYYNNSRVRVVLNNAVQDNMYYNIDKEQVSTFIVKSFKYYKK